METPEQPERLLQGQVPEELLNVRKAQFMGEVALQADTGPDVYTRAYNQAFVEALNTDADVKETFEYFLEFYSAITPQNLARRAIKSFQALEMHEDPSFPLGRDTPEAWGQVFDRLAKDDDYQAQFATNLMMPLASNVSERGKLLKASLLLNDKSCNVGILDVGCSLNHNLKRLAMYNRGGFDYDPVAVMGRTKGEPELDPAATAELNQMVRRESLTLSGSLGVDVINADKDLTFQNWARSNSFYMGELLNGELVEQFDRLAFARPLKVDTGYFDITKSNPERLPKKYDAVYLSTMLYQLSKNEVKKGLKTAEACATDNGLVVVQDFVEFSRGKVPRFHDTWSPWTYGVWVKDMSQPKLGYQKYFTVESGRCNRVILEPALGRLAVARERGLVPSDQR